MYTLQPQSVSTKRLPSTPRIEPQPGRGPRPVRSVGPGRLERAYQAQVARLSRELHSIHEAQTSAESELEMARLVERGTLRFVDRMEDRVRQREAQSRRALVLVGTLQHDNQLLQAKIQQLQGRLLALTAPESTGWIQKIKGRFGLLGSARKTS